MSNGFSELLSSIGEQTQRVLVELATPEHLKRLLEMPGSFDRILWDSAVEQGWPLVSVPESAGGLGLGWAGLAVQAGELGRITASLPLMANALAAHALLRKGDLHIPWVQPLIGGSVIATLALAEAGDGGLSTALTHEVEPGWLSGCKAPAAFSAAADVALVRAQTKNGVGLFLVNLHASGVQREIMPGYDNARAYARLSFARAAAVFLGGAELAEEVIHLAALVTAFEQVGGARACLEMACAYARERRAFGQQIGAFQGIKHKLAEIYCLIEIAHGCANDALAAWEQASPDRFKLSAAARLAAIHAYTQAAQENLHVHGGMGVTWEAMPHHHYRRSRSLALELGGQLHWRERLLCELIAPVAIDVQQEAA